MRVSRFESYLQSLLAHEPTIAHAVKHEDAHWILKPAGVVVKTWSGEYVGITVYRYGYPQDDARDPERVLRGRPITPAHIPRPDDLGPAHRVGWFVHQQLQNAEHPEISALTREPHVPTWVAYGLHAAFYSTASADIHIHDIDPTLDTGIDWNKYYPAGPQKNN